MLQLSRHILHLQLLVGDVLAAIDVVEADLVGGDGRALEGQLLGLADFEELGQDFRQFLLVRELQQDVGFSGLLAEPVGDHRHQQMRLAALTITYSRYAPETGKPNIINNPWPTMQPELLQHLYLTLQPAEYHSQYLKTAHSRVDARTTQQHRPLNITTSNNTVTVSHGNTIVIAALEVTIEQVVYSPVTKSYGLRLLSIEVPVQRVGKIERNQVRNLGGFVDGFVNWPAVEKQLVHKDEGKGITYAYRGRIVVRVAGSDGCVEETASLAVQMLLWTLRLRKLENVLAGKQDEYFGLKLEAFWFGIKYCYILDQLIIDPSAQQQHSCNWQLTLLCNIVSARPAPYTRVQKVHKQGSLDESLVKSVEGLFKVQLEKLGLDVRGLQAVCVREGGLRSVTVNNI